MDNLSMELVKGISYTKNEIESIGCSYIKETTITMYYRKNKTLYVFDAKPDKKLKYKLLTIDIEK